MCRGEDLNLHELPHTVLSRARLPIPPPRRVVAMRFALRVVMQLYYASRSLLSKILENFGLQDTVFSVSWFETLGTVGIVLLAYYNSVRKKWH